METSCHNLHVQGFRIDQDIEIFMPLYEGSLLELIGRTREKEKDAAPESMMATLKVTVHSMLSQILDALDFIHTRDPPIIHRDIKPANILYRREQFFLTDFGIAKHDDFHRTAIGTPWYMAPEVFMNHDQTTKVDIYGLGATIVDCLAGFPEGKMPFQQQHRCLQLYLANHTPEYAPVLADFADQRPTARWLLDHVVPLSSQAPSQLPKSDLSLSGLQLSSTLPRADGTTTTSSPPLTPMAWTQTVATQTLWVNPHFGSEDERMRAQQNPVAVLLSAATLDQPAQRAIGPGSIKSTKSVDGRQRKDQGRNGSSRGSRHTPSQYAGVTKPTPSGRRLRPRPKPSQKAQKAMASEMQQHPSG